MSVAGFHCWRVALWNSSRMRLFSTPSRSGKRASGASRMVGNEAAVLMGAPCVRCVARAASLVVGEVEGAVAPVDEHEVVLRQARVPVLREVEHAAHALPAVDGGEGVAHLRAVGAAGLLDRGAREVDGVVGLRRELV